MTKHKAQMSNQIRSKKFQLELLVSTLIRHSCLAGRQASFVIRIWILLAVVLSLGLFTPPATAAPLFSDPPCPPVEKPTVADTTKKTSATPAAPASTTPAATPAAANTVTGTVNQATSTSAANIFTFAAPDIVTRSKISDQTKLIDLVMNILLLLATVLFILLIPIGGLQWLAAVGNDEASTKAKRLLLNALIGLFLTLAAEGIGNLVFTQLGLNYSFRGILATVGVGTGSSGRGNSTGDATVPLGSRQVVFRLIVLSSSDRQPLKGMSLTFVGPQNSSVGGATTGNDGSVESTVIIPTETTVVNVYRSGNQTTSGKGPRQDTILGQFTIEADYTSYGCVSAVLNTRNILIPVTVQIQQATNFSLYGSAQMIVRVAGPYPTEPIQQFAISQNGGTITVDTHQDAVYQVEAVVPEYSTSHGSFTGPPFDENNPTRTVKLK